eukprot:1032046-Pelagomonas_calceolata.AAC.1
MSVSIDHVPPAQFFLLLQSPTAQHKEEHRAPYRLSNMPGCSTRYFIDSMDQTNAVRGATIIAANLTSCDRHPHVPPQGRKGQWQSAQSLNQAVAKHAECFTRSPAVPCPKREGQLQSAQILNQALAEWATAKRAKSKPGSGKAGSGTSRGVHTCFPAVPRPR